MTAKNPFASWIDWVSECHNLHEFEITLQYLPRYDTSFINCLSAVCAICCRHSSLHSAIHSTIWNLPIPTLCLEFLALHPHSTHIYPIWKSIGKSELVIVHNIFSCLIVAPRAVGADACSTPPIVHVVIPSLLRHRGLVVQHGAHAAPEKRIDEFAGTLPFEIRIVQLIVSIQHMQIFGQLLRWRKFIHMNIRSIRCTVFIVLRPGAHHNRQYVSAQCIHIELFGDVILAVGILERQIEFVVVVENVEAFMRCAARTFERAAWAVNVDLCEPNKNNEKGCN